jgi:hypothetical protein
MLKRLQTIGKTPRQIAASVGKGRRNISAAIHCGDRLAGGGKEIRTISPSPFALPDKPSIAALPFINMSR